jgi:hypothetical protein
VSSQTTELKNKYEFINLVLPYGFSPYVPEFDDGIDFILHRRSDNIHLNVQLKSRWAVEKKYFGRRIWIAFPSSNISVPRVWYLAPHDLMVELAKPYHGSSASWKRQGYSKPALPVAWEKKYQKYEINRLFQKITPKLASSTTGHAARWDT